MEGQGLASQISDWELDRISKLEKRLGHHRKLGVTLSPGSTLKHMNDRVMNEIEVKLFKLRKNFA